MRIAAQAELTAADALLARPGDPGEATAARLASNVAWSWVAWGASAFAPLVLLPLCVRYLGLRLYGEWLIILSLASYLGLAHLGLGQTVSNRIAEAIALDRRADVGTLVSTAYCAYAGVAAVLLAGLWALVAAAGRLSGSPDREVILAGGIYVTLIALSLPFHAHQMMLRGYQRVDRERALEAAGVAGRVAMVAVALLAGFKLLAVAAINGLGALAVAAGAYRSALRLDGAARPRLERCSWTALAAMVRPSAAFFALQIGWTLVLGVDNLVIGWRLGAAAVTPYAVSFRLMWTASALFTVAVNAFAPTVTSNFSRDRRDALERGYLVSLKLAILYAVCGATALWIVGPRFLTWWAGAGVFPGRTTFGLQLVAFVLVVWGVPSSTIMWATTRHYGWALLTVAEGVLNLALSAWWLRYWGLAGVIAGTLGAAAVTNGWYITFGAMRTLEISGARMFAELWPGAALAGGAAGAWALGAVAAPALSAVIGCAIVVIFAAAYLTVGFTPGERAALQSWFATRETK